MHHRLLQSQRIGWQTSSSSSSGLAVAVKTGSTHMKTTGKSSSSSSAGVAAAALLDSLLPLMTAGMQRTAAATGALTAAEAGMALAGSQLSLSCPVRCRTLLQMQQRQAGQQQQQRSTPAAEAATAPLASTGAGAGATTGAAVAGKLSMTEAAVAGAGI
jgi:hypothetical protein